MLSYEQVKQNERELLALTGLTVDEFEALETAFSLTWQATMRQRTMAGRPRYERAHSDYANSPFPTGAAKLLFILVYLKQAPTQTVQGRLFGLSQSNANKWIHLLVPILNQTLAELGVRPARSAAELNQRWERLQPRVVPEPTEEHAAAASLFSTMAPSG